MDGRIASIIELAARRGFIETADVVRLVEGLSPGGRFETKAGFAAALTVAEATGSKPVVLALLAEIREMVISGDGVACAGRPHYSRVVDAADADLIRRVLLAGGGRTGQPVDADEAEVLFDIHDAAAEAINDPSWDDLFVKAIGLYVLAASGHRVQPRPDALKRDPRLDERRGVFGIFAAVRDAGYRGVSVDDVLPALIQTLPSSDKPLVDSMMAAWLAKRVMRDAKPTASERALSRLLLGGAAIDPSVASVLIRAA